MSGGVDSSVAAALLKRSGFDVQGVFFRLWKDNQRDDYRELGDLKKVARKLGIPIKIVDLKNDFQKEVVGHFLSEYGKGNTPNPCVFCNKNFKFKHLFEEAEKIGADFVSTGHYARIIRKKGNVGLYRALDEKKDQSYFLYRLSSEELSRSIFPLGGLEKKDVRKLAKELGLAVSEKKDSQDVCFLEKSGTDQFLRKMLKQEEGKILDENGKEIGIHQGLALYTIGQRKGINIGGTGPYYVVSRDKRRNILRVTNSKNREDFLMSEILLEKANFIPEKVDFPLKALAQTRYQQKPFSAIIRKAGKNKLSLVSEIPQWGAAPGQSAVFFSEKGEVLGGGIIS